MASQYDNGIAIEYTKSNKSYFTFTKDAGGSFSVNEDLNYDASSVGNLRPTTYLSSYDRYHKRDGVWVTSKFIKEADIVYICKRVFKYVDGNFTNDKTFYRALNSTKNEALDNFQYYPVKQEYDGGDYVESFTEHNKIIAYRGFPLGEFYDLAGGSISLPVESVDSNQDGVADISISGLNLEFFQNESIVNADLSVTTEITASKGSMTYPAKYTIRKYDDIIDVHYLLSDIDEVYDSGDTVTFDVTIHAKYRSNHEEFDSYTYSTNITPITINESMKATFVSSTSTDVDGYYGLENRVKTTADAIDAAYYRTVVLFDVDDLEIKNTDRIYSAGGTKFYNGGYFEMGKEYKLVTKIIAPFITQQYESYANKLYSITNSYNIRDVSFNVVGKDSQTNDVDSVLYVGEDEELSGSVDVRPIYSDGDVSVETNFKLYSNSTVKYDFEGRGDNNVFEETRPTHIYLICINNDSTLYADLFNTKLSTHYKQSFRDKDTLALYPNVTRAFGEDVYNALPATATVLEDGVVYNKKTYSIDALSNGTEYSIACPVTENGNYTILLMLSIQLTGFESSYTTYELSNVPNVADNVTQFDVTIKE